MSYFSEGIRMTGRFFLEELRIIKKDPGVILMFIVAIMAYPLIYSIAYQNELVRDIPVAMVDQDHTGLSRQYARMLDATQQMKLVTKYGSMDEAKKAFFNGDVKGVVLVPADFEKQILTGKQTSVSIYGDASYFLFYKQALAGTMYSSFTLSAGIEVKKLLASGSGMEQALNQRDPLSCNIYNLYNPSAGYGSFVMPGMILIILQQTLLIGIGMLGGTRREKSNNPFSIPVRMRKGEIFPALMGKAGAYLFIYLLNSVYALLWIYHWFGFPNKGNLVDVLILLIPFFLSISFLGLTFSVLFKKREHSIIFLVFLSPIIFFLSGVSWPASAIPSFLYKLAHIFPSTVMVPAYLRVRTMGVGLAEVNNELIFLIVQTVVYCLLACLAFRYSLSKSEDCQANNL